nr:hypothetical protein [Clostridioides difficile]
MEVITLDTSVNTSFGYISTEFIAHLLTTSILTGCVSVSKHTTTNLSLSLSTKKLLTNL